ncbi:hypothetical protein ACFQZS_13560 [Mucilaginibacter calamicampi]|uniref:Uncharacterized protein n=1 Tax=Mucilaginibacter calamicampi TaxID=1302352 RepID=A0ABW2YXS9_9SPHI
MLSSFISYDGLPLKSGGAHMINNADRLQTYNTLSAFFESMTTNPSCVNTIELDIFSREEESKAKFWYMVRTFGLPNWSFFGSSRGGFIWTFNVDEKQMLKAIELTKKFGNVALRLVWRFQFVDIDTKEILNGQNEIPVIDERKYNSEIYVRLAKNASISLWLTLPFGHLDEKTASYIDLLKAKLPVKLSNNHWKIWTLSKNGTWMGRKLDVSGIVQ